MFNSVAPPPVPSIDGTTALAPSARHGTPIDPWRVVGALVKRRRRALGLLIVTGIAGVAVAKFALPHNYSSSATVQWEAPATAKADPGREVATIAQSVKLPQHLREVRKRLGREDRLEALAKRVEVKPGENSMLVTVSAQGSSGEEAAALAQTTVDVFLEAQRARAREHLEVDLAAIRQSLVQAEQSQTAARGRYDAFRAEHDVDDFPAEVQASIQELVRLRIASNDARIELDGLQARERALRTAHAGRPQTVVLSRNEQSPDEIRRAQLDTELTELRAHLAEDHPRVKTLLAERDAVRTRADVEAPTITGQTVGRDTVRESLTLQVEESNALHQAVLERTHTLKSVLAQAEERASHLSGVQGEAARLLSDVKANDEHVGTLMKQLATAEDDVRAAQSGFQLVSRAHVPENHERGIGRVVALAAPLAALLLFALWTCARELAGLRLRTASEVAYWGRGPVLWSTTWPRVRPDAAAGELADMTRELADAVERRPAVLGILALGDCQRADDVAELLVNRLHERGRTACVELAPESAEILEHRAFGERLAGLAEENRHVLLTLRRGDDVSALRAALRWLDGVLVVVPAGAQGPRLAAWAKSLGLDAGGYGFVLVGTPETEVGSPVRRLGHSASLFRGPAGSSFRLSEMMNAIRSNAAHRSSQEAFPPNLRVSQANAFNDLRESEMGGGSVRQSQFGAASLRESQLGRGGLRASQLGSGSVGESPFGNGATTRASQSGPLAHLRQAQFGSLDVNVSDDEEDAPSLPPVSIRNASDVGAI